MSGTSTTIGGRFAPPIFQIMDAQGIPIAGATCTFYATGTSSPQSVYADALLTTPLSNPIVANAAGIFPQAFLVSDPAYRVVLADATGAVIGDYDPVSGIPTLGFGTYSPGMVPIGTIVPFTGTAIPSGWLLCDGSTAMRDKFPRLFALLGTSFGVGDGARTFGIPDLRGSVPVGLDNMGGVAANRVTYAGSHVDGLTLGFQGGDQYSQQHGHSITDVTHNHNDTGHVHPITGGALQWPTLGGPLSGGGGTDVTFPAIYATDTGYTNLAAAYTGITATQAALAGASENMQPCLIVNYIIYAGA